MQRIADIIIRIDYQDSAARYTALGGVALQVRQNRQSVDGRDRGPMPEHTDADHAQHRDCCGRVIVPKLWSEGSRLASPATSLWDTFAGLTPSPPYCGARIGPIGCELAQHHRRRSHAVVEMAPRVMLREVKMLSALLG
jgi:hypothetical protein